MGPRRLLVLLGFARLLAACGRDPDPPADAAAEEVFVEDLIVPQPPVDVPPPRDRSALDREADPPDAPDVVALDVNASDRSASDADGPTPDLDPCAAGSVRRDAGVVPAADSAADRVLTDIGCAPGEVLCHGFCTDLSTATWSCGVCELHCPFDARCVSGVCVCPEGTTACGDRCVNLRREVRHCGACGRACPVSQQCLDGACSCEVGTTYCAPYCSRLNYYEHCGACGRACAGAPNASPYCVRGTCATRCWVEYGDCDGAPANGCERDLRSDPNHCGACGRRCAVAGGDTTCVNSRCQIARCPAGTADCDRDAANGCEERLDSSPYHCGACDRSCLPGATCVGGACVCPTGVASCAAPPRRDACSGSAAACPTRVASTPVCALGGCGIRCQPASENPYGDCDRNEATGCETIVSTSAHCGRCGNACARDQNCVDGACVCPPGHTRCGDRCADPSRDRAHCGACGRACAADEDCAEGACAARRGVRPIAPITTARVTTRRPSLRWRLGRGYDGARVELCADRACARVITSLVASGERAAPEVDLPRGVVFWRLHGRRAGGAFDAPSVTWEFVVGPRSAPADTSHGGFADFNGDGLADFVQFREDRIERFYVAHVYHGAPGGLVPAPTARLPGATGDLRRLNGYNHAMADLDGDGFTDLIAPDVVPLERDDGATRFYLHRGGPAGMTGGPPQEITLRSLDGLNVWLSEVGDVDGDGYVDLAAGRGDGIERVYIYPGGPGGPRAVPMTMMSAQHGRDGGFGAGVSGAGDLNGDGYGDLAVGEPRTFGGLGFAHVFLGGPTGPSGVADVTLPNPAPGRSRFTGRYLAPADHDGDGLSDLGVLVDEFFGGNDLWLLRGTSGGVERPGTFAPLHLAISVATWADRSGDFDGDGVLDLVVGDSEHRADASTGRLLVLPGASPCGRHIPYPVAAAVSFEYHFGRKVVVPGDVNGDGLDDVFVWSDENAWLFFGAPGGLSPGPAQHFDLLP